jgi:uncharacterized RDD family membrane protein YckC
MKPAWARKASRAADQPQLEIDVMPQRVAAVAFDTGMVFLLQWLVVRLIGPAHITALHSSKLHGTIGFAFSKESINLWWGILVVVLYFMLFEVLFAATPGKTIAGVRVVDRNGQRLSRRAAIVRNLIRPLDAWPLFYGVGALSVVFSPLRQRLGDRAAGTVVVRARSVPWTDLTAEQARRRAFVCAAAVVAAFAAAILFSYLNPAPAIGGVTSGAGSGSIYSISVPHASRLLSLNLGTPQRNGGTLTYHMRYDVATGSSSGPHHCSAVLTLHWHGSVLEGWVWDHLENRCLGSVANLPL